MTVPVYNQNGFRFYDDDSTLSWTQRANENTDITVSGDDQFILRIEIEITNAKAMNNDVFEIWAAKNGGTYAEVTTARADGIAMSGDFTDTAVNDGSADNNNRESTSSLTFSGGILHDYGSVSDIGGTNPLPDGMDFVGQDHWEIGLSIAFDVDATGVTDADYWEFELRGAAGATLDNYARRPKVTYSAGAPTVVMGYATLASSAQALTVSIPVIVSASEATLTGSPQTLAVLAPPPPITIPITEATLVSSAQTLAVLAGEVTVALTEATLAGSAETLAVLAGEVTVALSEATLVSSAQTAEVSLATYIQCQAVTLTPSAESLAILVGEVQIPMTEATLTGSAETLNVSGATLVPMTAITLSGSAETIVVLLAIILNMQEITLTGSAETLTVSVEGVGLPSFRATARGVLRGVGRGV